MTDAPTTTEPTQAQPATAQPPAMDPITAMSVEVDGLKKKLGETEAALATTNKNMEGVINANKSMYAALQRQPTQPQGPPEPTEDERMMKSFYTALGIKKG